MNSVTMVRELSPDEAAEQIYAAHAHEGAWLDAFSESLDRRRASRSFARTMEVWGLSQAEAARLFGVSRQALAKWVQHGNPFRPGAGRLGSGSRHRSARALSQA